MRRLAAVVALLAGVALAGGLDDDFAKPPAEARPWVYWFVMDGNFTREGITADLEAMARQGIGGAIFMEVNVGIPRGPVQFMSPQWRELFKHADAEARRLGLSITLNAGPGWTGTGGPWVKPGQSMQHLVASATEVDGPGAFEGVLARPAARQPYFGTAGVPAELLKKTAAFYEDVVVLAVPRTAQTARIAEIDEKALFLRHPYSSRPGTKAFIPSPAKFDSVPDEGVAALETVVNLTDRMDKEGRLKWAVPAGQWTVLRFGRTSTGANTRPAPLPGLGLECDKMDPAALEAHYEQYVGTLLKELGPREAGKGWNMLHIDSWEMGAQNWTPGLVKEFERRRGYDPTPYLPVTTGRIIGSVEVSERFLWDLRQTAQELVIENHARRLRELGHKSGLGLSIEPYDMNPCSDMSLGSEADVPMCEFWLHGFKTWFSVFEAASVAHTLGRTIVAAEAFTSSAAEHWQAHPASMKALGDWAFCSGVNRIAFHRYQHQPTLDQRPGMTMGPYGVHWERTQTWWEMSGAYHRYLARCQAMLRRGLHVADVCFLAAEGAPHVFRPPSSATTGEPPDKRGYAFDAISPEALVERMTVKDGRLMLPDGTSYQALVLPERETMTPGLLSKVKSLVDAGATVIGPRPRKSPSLSEHPLCDDQVAALAEALWGQAKVIAPPAAGDRRGEEPPLDKAKWIWHREEGGAMKAAVARRYFRRTLKVGAAVSALVRMTADNAYELRVNGKKAGEGSDFHVVDRLEITGMLHPGDNEILVAAENGGDAPNPAGLVGALLVREKDGRVVQLTTDGRWESAESLDGPWAAAVELGPLDMAPWKLRPDGRGEQEQYCGFDLVSGVLNRKGVPPDFESDGPIRFIHRREGETEIYFVANREEKAVEASCVFRVAGKSPELMDPLTGEARDLPEYAAEGGRTRVPMRFEPAQSFFVVFRKPAGPNGGGRNFAALKAAGEVTGPWQVAFDPKCGGPQSVRFERLQDWRDRPEAGVRFYSGVATYRTSFQAAPAGRMFLDLGQVRNLAAVRLNGKDLGVVWCAPWRAEITQAVVAGENRLEIDLANLWPNRLIGDQALPAEQRYAKTTWNPFRKDSPLLPSGLLGPVTLWTGVAK